MWELDCEEGWVPKNWCFWTVVLEKTLESPLDCKEIQPVHWISPGISLEGMMLKLKFQDFGHLMRRVDSLEKTLMLGGIGGKRRRGRQSSPRLDGRGSGWTPGVDDGQGGLACYDSWGREELDTTEWLNWTELNDLIKHPCVLISWPPQICWTFSVLALILTKPGLIVTKLKFVFLGMFSSVFCVLSSFVLHDYSILASVNIN